MSIKMESDTLLLTMSDLSRGGSGVGRAPDGRVVFVPYTAPGDLVRVKLIESKKNFAQGEVIEILEPSPLRQTPPCPVFGQCGGCQWQHLSYELQWKTKLGGVLQALSRAKVEKPVKLDELPAERIWEYRNRVQLRGFKNELGFFKSGSNERISVDRCAIARPEINAVWEETRAKGMSHDKPYKVEVEVLPDSQGQQTIRRTWNSVHGAAGFRQVHDEQNEKLKAWVASAIEARGAVLDLYGGAGNLSLGLNLEVDCVDVGAPEDQVTDKVKFHCQSVASWIVKKAALKPTAHYESAILDPPREGLGADFGVISESLDKLGVREIVAVGCDADAWARDVSRLMSKGWVLDRAAVLDLFPQTSHVESIARLVRPSRS